MSPTLCHWTHVDTKTVTLSLVPRRTAEKKVFSCTMCGDTCFEDDLEEKKNQVCSEGEDHGWPVDPVQERTSGQEPLFLSLMTGVGDSH